MNKIKLMYDLARAMKDKDTLDGTVKLKVKKDGLEAFQMDNEFSRDFTNGWGKARISTTLDYEGKQFKHESTTEFNMNQDQEAGPHGSCRLFHKHHGGMHGGGLKGRLERIMALLNALNNMKVVEEEDKSIWLSLDLSEIPDDLQEALSARMMHRHHDRPGFLSGSPAIEKGSLECRISKNYEIETITVKLEGKLQAENHPDNDLTLDAAVNFAW